MNRVGQASPKVLARSGDMVNDRWGNGRKRRQQVLVLIGMVSLISIGVAPVYADAIFAGGDNAKGQCNVPLGNNFKAISTGFIHGVALRTNGSLVAWGDNTYNQTDVPKGNSFKAVSGIYINNVAIRTNGSLVAWGNNSWGQCNVPVGTGYKAVATGYLHGVAIRSNNSLVAWGDNSLHQTEVPPGNNYKAVSAGAAHSVALRTDGTLVAWGLNDDNQCNIPAGKNYKAISAGQFHSVALRTDGTLIAWGDNSSGQCDVSAGNNFVAISAGKDTTAAIRKDGTVFCTNGDPPGSGYTAVSMGFGGHSLGLVIPTEPKKVTPARAKPGQSLTLSITGSGFTPGTTAKLVNGPETILPGKIKQSGTAAIQCSFTVPFLATPGAWQLNVTNNRNQNYTLPFTITPLPAPQLTKIIPSPVYRGANVSATITGKNFVSPVTIILSQVPPGVDTIIPTSTKVNSQAKITCTYTIRWDQQAGAYSLSVTNPDGTSATLADALVVKPALKPTVLGISPATTHISGSFFNAIINGKNFTKTDPASVGVSASHGFITIGGTVTKINSATSLSARFLFPPGIPAGKYNITVRYPLDPDMTNATGVDKLTLLVP